MNTSIEYLKSKLPLTIEDLSWVEPAFHLSGNQWRFNARTEWRIITRDKKLIGCYDDVDEILESLKCLQIISVYSQSEYYFDPVFILENGWVIEIFSSSSMEETWTIKFEDDEVFMESHETLK